MAKVDANKNVSAEYQIVNGKKVKKQDKQQKQKQVFNNKGQKAPQKPNDSAVKQEVYKKSGYQLKDTKDADKPISLMVYGKMRTYKTVGTLTTGGRILVQDEKGAYHVVSHTKDNKLVMLKDDYAKNKIFYENTSAEHKVKIGKKSYVITNANRDRHGRMSAIDENGKRVVLSADRKELKMSYVEAEDQRDNMNDYIAKATKGKSKDEAAKIRKQIMEGNSSYSNKGVLRFKASNGEVWYYDTKRKTYVKYSEKEAQAIIKDLDKGAKEDWGLFRTGLGTDYELLKNTNAQIVDPEVLNRVNKHYSVEYGNKVDKNAEYGSGKYRTAYEAFLASEIGDDEVYQFNATLVKNNAITDQSRRNEVLKTNLTKVGSRENRMAAADAASRKEDYQALQDVAEEENKKQNYKQQFKGQDALQTYVYGVNKGDVQEVDDFNNVLIDPKEDMLDRDEIVRIKAETGALWAKEGKLNKAFQSQDSEVINKMFELQNVDGKTKALDVKTLKTQAAEKHQEDYMMQARPDLYSNKQLAQKAVELLKGALQSFKYYEDLHYGTVVRTDDNALALQATETNDIKTAENYISRAYTLIRDKEILDMVKKEMGKDFEVLMKKEKQHFQTNHFETLTTINKTQADSTLTPEQIAHNKYVVNWLKAELEDLERSKNLNEAKDGWKQDFVNYQRETYSGYATRSSLANKYQLIKSNIARLEAAAEGKLVDANGKPVSFDDAMKKLGDTGLQVLEQANGDYQSAQQMGEFAVDMVTLAIPIPGLSAGNFVRVGGILYKVIGASGKAYKAVKVAEEFAKGSKVINYSLKVADAAATGGMHMASKTAILEATNIATSREGFTSDRISEMNEKVKGSAEFGAMGGAIGGVTGVVANEVTSTVGKYMAHTAGLAADVTAAAGLITAESNGETNYVDNLLCINPDGSFNFEQAAMTAMMVFGHLHGMSNVKQPTIRERINRANSRDDFNAIKEDINKLPKNAETRELFNEYLKKFREWGRAPERASIKNDARVGNGTVNEEATPFREMESNELNKLRKNFGIKKTSDNNKPKFTADTNGKTTIINEMKGNELVKSYVIEKDSAGNSLKFTREKGLVVDSEVYSVEGNAIIITPEQKQGLIDNANSIIAQKSVESLGIKPSEGNRLSFQIDEEGLAIYDVDANDIPSKRYKIAFDNDNGASIVDVADSNIVGETSVPRIPEKLSDVEDFVNKYSGFEKQEVEGKVVLKNRDMNISVEYDKDTNRRISETQIDENGLVQRGTFNEDGVSFATVESDFVYEGNLYKEIRDVNEGTKSYQQIVDKSTRISTDVKPELAEKFANGHVEEGKFIPNEQANDVAKPNETVNADKVQKESVKPEVEAKAVEKPKAAEDPKAAENVEAPKADDVVTDKKVENTELKPTNEQKAVEEAKPESTKPVEKSVIASESEAIQSPFEITADKIVVNGKEQPIPKNIDEAKELALADNISKYRDSYGDFHLRIKDKQGNSIDIAYRTTDGHYYRTTEQIISDKTVNSVHRNSDGVITGTEEQVKSNSTTVTFFKDSEGKIKNLNIKTEDFQGAYAVDKNGNLEIGAHSVKVIENPELKTILKKHGIKLVDKTAETKPIEEAKPAEENSSTESKDSESGIVIEFDDKPTEKSVIASENEAIQPKQKPVESTPVTTSQERAGNSAEQAAQINDGKMNNVEPTSTAQVKNLEKYETMLQTKEGKELLDEVKKDPNLGKTVEERIPSDKIVKDADGNLQSIEVDGVTYKRNEQGEYVNEKGDSQIQVINTDVEGGYVLSYKYDKTIMINSKNTISRIESTVSSNKISVEYDTSNGQPTEVSILGGKSIDLSTGVYTLNFGYTRVDPSGRVITTRPIIDINGREYRPTMLEGHRYTDYDNGKNGKYIDYDVREKTKNSLSKQIEDAPLENRGLRTTKKARQKNYEDVRNQIEDAYNNNKISREIADNLHTKLNEKAKLNGLETQETPTMKAEREALAKWNEQVDSLKDSLMSEIEKVDSQAAHDQMVEKIGEICKNNKIDMKRANELYDALEAKANSIDGVESLAQKKAKIETQVREIETHVTEKPVAESKSEVEKTVVEPQAKEPAETPAEPNKPAEKPATEEQKPAEDAVKKGVLILPDDELKPVQIKTSEEFAQEDRQPVQIKTSEEFAQEDRQPVQIKTSEEFAQEDRQPVQIKTSEEFAQEDRQPVQIKTSEEFAQEDRQPVQVKTPEELTQKATEKVADSSVESKANEGESATVESEIPEPQGETGEVDAGQAVSPEPVSTDNTTTPKKSMFDRLFHRNKAKNEDGTTIPKSLRGEDGTGLKEGIVYDKDSKQYKETIQEGNKTTTTTYDEKGRVRRKAEATTDSGSTITVTKDYEYNSKGKLVSEKESSLDGFKTTEYTKEYNLVHECSLNGKSQKLTIKYNDGYKPKVNGTEIASKEYTYEDGKFISKKDGNIVETVEYNQKDHTWTIKDANGKEVESHDNMKTSNKLRNTVKLASIAGAVGGIGYGIYQAVKSDNEQTVGQSQKTAKHTDKPKPNTSNQETKVTLGDSEGTISADGTITIGGKTYPKNEDGTYTIDDKNYKLEDNKLVEVEPEETDSTDNADSSDSSNGTQEVTGTIEGKNYSIKDGVVTIDGHDYDRGDDGYYNIDGVKYTTDSEGKLVKVDETQDPANTSTDNDGANAETSQREGATSSANSATTVAPDRTSQVGTAQSQDRATTSREDNTSNVDNSQGNSRDISSRSDMATERRSGNESVATGGGQRTSDNTGATSRRTQPTRPIIPTTSADAVQVTAPQSQNSVPNETSGVVEPTDAQKQAASALQEEISTINTQNDVKKFLDKLTSAVRGSNITVMQCDELKNLVTAHVESLLEVDKLQQELDSKQIESSQSTTMTPVDSKAKEKREISPVERMELTEKIRKAKTRQDIQNIQQEMRQYKVFQGRKNLRRAYKAKLRAFKHQGEPNAQKYNDKFDKRMEKIENSKVYIKDKNSEFMKKNDNVDDVVNIDKDIRKGFFEA